jgi:hypothetical protein
MGGSGLVQTTRTSLPGFFIYNGFAVINKKAWVPQGKLRRSFPEPERSEGAFLSLSKIFPIPSKPNLPPLA